MGRFHLFAGQGYYPQGGMNDYRGSFATLEEARAAAEAGQQDPDELEWEWANIGVEQDGRLMNVLGNYAEWSTLPDGVKAWASELNHLKESR